MGEGEQASGAREGGEPPSTTVITGSRVGESPAPGQPRVQVTPRAVLVVMLTALALLGGLYLLWELRNIVVWCMVAVFLTVALNPAVDWLDRHGFPRVVAIVLVYLALLFLVVGITALLLPPLISQGQALVTFVIDLVRNPPGGTPQAALQDLADSYGLGGYLNDYLDTLRDQIGSLPERLSGAVAPLVSVTRSIIGGVVSLISVLLLTFFLLLDGKRFVEMGLLLVEPSRRPRVQRLLNRSAQAVSGYITGNLAISLIAGVATYITLVLLGVPYALTLALVVAFFDLIPLVGATLGAIIVIAVGLFTSPLTAVILVAYFVVYQQVENHVLQPLVYSRSVHLHPIVVFLAAVAGAELLGILGALLAIPVAEILRILGTEWFAARAARSGGSTECEPVAEPVEVHE